MLDPHEPDTSTPETSEQPPAQPAARRRRAASRPAGPPSSAPDAPSIHRTSGLPDSDSENSTEAEVAPVNEKTARKSAVKRTTKKSRAEAPPSEGEVVKTPRRRTAKKAVAMATEAPSDEALSGEALSGEAGVPSLDPQEAAPTLEEALLV